ncbi:hypothetical protein U4I65_08290 [Stenotrophomonas maltophilia]|uniref:hypothetical protein n=1 Tax=Stenotrophomonas maltophilia group TaxID=995085 RepID=UPI000A6FC170|nr:hypothetical protein [Stenotrophomonas maltophilia]MDZ5815031.1 hypothetical protein [Stenotrophomonas maltophilia]
MDANETRARAMLASIFTCDPAELTRDEVRAARAVLAWQVAQGFVLVPVEPTDEMLLAAHRADTTRAPITSRWSAMLAARPEVPS